MTRNPTYRVIRLLVSLLLVLASQSFPVTSLADTKEVDLALVLAVDCSYSVDATEFRLQMQGLAEAFRRPDIHQAIQNGENGRIAVVVMQWSDIENQHLLGSWVVLDTPASALAFADHIARARRELTAGGTAIGDALRAAASILQAARFATDRRVIDISSDGHNNRGDPVTIARDEVVAKGVTINGLAILSEFPALDTYFQRHLVGGRSHFVIAVNSYDSFANAIARKLLHEITGPGIS